MRYVSWDLDVVKQGFLTRVACSLCYYGNGLITRDILLKLFEVVY